MPKTESSEKEGGEGTIPLATKNESAAINKPQNMVNKNSKGPGKKTGEMDVTVNLTEPAGTSSSSKKENVSEPAAKRAAPAAFQFKITLKDSEPLIWRRIQVPKGYTFSEFHTTIMEAMGWRGGHCHCFKIFDSRKKNNVEIGPNYPDEDDDTLDENKEKLLKYFPKKTNVAEYEYDFGDSWVHEILFEGEVPRKPNGIYPQCLAGERACPPEDCGGIPGYEDLCKILKNPKHPEYAEMKSWVKDMGIKRFAPDKFDPNKVKFSLVKPQYGWVFCPSKPKPKLKFKF